MSYQPYLCTLAQAKTEINTNVDGQDANIYNAIRDVSARVEQYKECEFEPLHTTRAFDAIGGHIVDNGQTLLLARPLLEIESIALGDGTALTTDDYILYPKYETPKTKIVLKSHTWTAYEDAPEQANEIEAVWGYHTDYASAWVSLSTLAEDVTSSETAIDVTALSGALFSPGMLIRFGSTDDYARVTAVTTDTLTVVRGQNGTTAAEHLTGVAVSYWQPYHIAQRAAQLWAVYAFARRGSFESATYDGVTTVTFPLAMPGRVKDELDSFRNARLWATTKG
jgi:hypothetical protein